MSPLEMKVRSQSGDELGLDLGLPCQRRWDKPGANANDKTSNSEAA